MRNNCAGLSSFSLAAAVAAAVYNSAVVDDASVLDVDASQWPCLVLPPAVLVFFLAAVAAVVDDASVLDADASQGPCLVLPSDLVFFFVKMRLVFGGRGALFASIFLTVLPVS